MRARDATAASWGRPNETVLTMTCEAAPTLLSSTGEGEGCVVWDGVTEDCEPKLDEGERDCVGKGDAEGSAEGDGVLDSTMAWYSCRISPWDKARG
jgi:hypothetical protein